VITHQGLPVIRTQIQLTDNQARELKRWAQERGVSMAMVIREAVDEHLRRRGRPAWDDLVAQAIAAAGTERSGTGDVAERHDDYFVDAAYETEPDRPTDDRRDGHKT